MFRRPDESYAEYCAVNINRIGGGGLSISARISRDFKSDLHIMRSRLNATAYRDTILQPIVALFMRNKGITLLQQDNAIQKWPGQLMAFYVSKASTSWHGLQLAGISTRQSICGIRLGDASVVVKCNLKTFNKLRLLSIRDGQHYMHSIRPRCETHIGAVGG